MGESFKEAKWAAEDAIRAGNYKDLIDICKNFGEDAIDIINQTTGSFCGNDKDFDPLPKGDPKFRGGQGGQPGFGRERFRQQREQNRNQYRQQNRSQYRQGGYQKTNPVNYSKTRTVKVSSKKVKGRVSSVLYTVFGSLGTIGFGIAAFVLACIFVGTGFSNGTLSLLSTIFTVVALGNIGILSVGLRKGKFINRYGIYYSLLEKNQFCEISRLAEYVGKSKQFVIRDLKKMMQNNMFQEAHFDRKMTCFILGDENYQHYIDAQQNFEQRQSEAKKQEQTTRKQQENKVVNEELEKAIAEGRSYIAQVRKANDDIPGEEISRKLDKLEQVITRIFICVEKHPEKLPEIRKFMEYYLPITIKLVNAYKEFDSQTIQGENIQNSKKEIETTLDTIELAFEKLLDSLYEDEAMEVSSDISVLNALFAQEGLTKKDFDLKK